jgi:glucose 1-dehydrogenase
MSDHDATTGSSWCRGRSVLVTGAAGGMGAAIATAFARAGGRVVLADVVADVGEETASALRDDGGEAVFVRTDVSLGDDVAAAVAVAVDRYGGLDCAVNAAAIETERGPVHECDDEVFDRLIAVNLRSVFLSLKYEIRAMLATGRRGAIVNIASTSSFRPQPNQPGYTASKHGVLGITRATAVDYGRMGLRINAICPGAIDTPMLRAAMERRSGDPADVTARLSLFSRFGQVEEIAEAAMWLCSPASSFTTGHALAVDGGYLSR